jgi:peptidoglycan/LPS O-acetylase OafA/YrhL
MRRFGFLGFQSLDQIMAVRKGSTTGFDYLRIGLSLGVLLVHCLWIADPTGWRFAWTSWLGGIERSILPAFFILSGFLVLGSLYRNNVPQFIALRLVRLVPALAVEITLTALVIGLIFTTLPVGEYLRSAEFHAYFLNLVGDIHYTLPGVFHGALLNVQLWTIPFELECYIMIVTLAVLGVFQHRKLFIVLLVTCTIGATILSYHNGWPTLQSVVSGRVLVFGFLYGCSLYVFKDSIPYSKYLFAASCAATYILFSIPHATFLGLIPLSYATVYFGTLKLPRIPFGDLSYGVFLFHFPVAVLVFQVAHQAISWEALAIIVLLLSGMFAFGSWTLIERPVLSRKLEVLRIVDKVTQIIVKATVGQGGIPGPSVIPRRDWLT